MRDMSGPPWRAMSGPMERHESLHAWSHSVSSIEETHVSGPAWATDVLHVGPHEWPCMERHEWPSMERHSVALHGETSWPYFLRAKSVPPCEGHS